MLTLYFREIPQQNMFFNCTRIIHRIEQQPTHTSALDLELVLMVNAVTDVDVIRKSPYSSPDLHVIRISYVHQSVSYGPVHCGYFLRLTYV